MHVYCLFCQTEKCPIVPKVLERYGYERAIYPQIMMRERVQGKNVDVRRNLLPGYVFVYQEEAVRDVAELKRIAGARRVLGNPDHGYELRNADYDFAITLLGKDGLINAVRVVRVGEKVTLADPVFAACEGEVTKVDQRKQRARVDFVFNGMSCHTWVAYEMVKRVGDGDPEAEAVKEATGEKEDNETQE